MVFDLEVLAIFFDHFVVEVGTIINHDFIWDPITTYDLFLQEISHHLSYDVYV